MNDEHRATCICRDCLPGGTREHRVRPYGGVSKADCTHGGPAWHHETVKGLVTRAEVRYRVTLLGGDSILLCRLCGTVLERTPKNVVAIKRPKKRKATP